MDVVLNFLFFLIAGAATTPLPGNVTGKEEIKSLRWSKRVGSDSEHCRLINKGTCGPCQCMDDRRLVKKYYCDCSNLQAKRDCLEFYQQGMRVDGVYVVHQNNLKKIQVFCDQTTDGGGWTVLVRRQDGSVNFYRDWLNYKEGFGDLQNEFWLGNEQLFTMTLQAQYPALHQFGSELRIELGDWQGEKRYAKYSDFGVGNEFTKYVLNIDGYSGNAGDSGSGMTYHNGQKFSTYDQDATGNCASGDKGGWWYDNCAFVQFTGRYYFYKDSVPGETGIIWHYFHGNSGYSLKFAEMKMRRKT